MADGLFANLRHRYEQKGDKRALLQAILYASMFGRRLPKWAADAFKAAYERVERGDAESWDDAFGRPHPAGKHLKSVRLDFLQYELWGMVNYLHEHEGRPIDEELFEAIGQKFGLGKTTVNKRYYAAKRALEGVKIWPDPLTAYVVKVVADALNEHEARLPAK